MNGVSDKAGIAVKVIAEGKIAQWVQISADILVGLPLIPSLLALVTKNVFDQLFVATLLMRRFFVALFDDC